MRLVMLGMHPQLLFASLKIQIPDSRNLQVLAYMDVGVKPFGKQSYGPYHSRPVDLSINRTAYVGFNFIPNYLEARVEAMVLTCAIMALLQLKPGSQYFVEILRMG
ncbi:hypothetical protein AG1IA_09421 [Rhizoctonia solani AG-1 IA]|uniref:Uncharacterized protein n=1 Tax=Thanatephorus cucumeris (strain AG1-IA) TaxID=983506 RepID=L8WEC2_THACA|nr:hypothetical protein AG1IA_09421 [Rhizoctonia solani AG-1 IA]